MRCYYALMARPPRVDVAGYAYHVLNRANSRSDIFLHDGDYAAFEQILEEAVVRSDGGIRLLVYCLMSNHWHLVIHTSADGAMGQFAKWLTTTHATRYRTAHRSIGRGHVYQDRYRSFLVETDRHLLTVCRYVERNAAEAGLVPRAEAWRWSSLWRWCHGDEQANAWLSDWPVATNGGRPRNWLRTVNTPMNARELEKLRASSRRMRPYGSPQWVQRMVRRHGLESTMRSRGRPAATTLIE